MAEVEPRQFGDAGMKAAELVQSSVVKITREAFKDAPPAVKAVLYAPAISGAVFGLGLISSLFFLDAGEKWLSLIFGALLLFGLYIPHWKPLRLDGSLLQLSGIPPAVPVSVPVTPAPIGCRHIPSYPPAQETRDEIRAGLEEIRKHASNQIRAKFPEIPDNDIRANVFLPAMIRGGPADGTWRLVIHEDLAINMNFVPERKIQLQIGRGAAGVSFRDGVFHLTRRAQNPKGEWDIKFQMTPELSGQIHKRLKWILSFPLLKPDTEEAIGVLNIDGLSDGPDDDLLNAIASSLAQQVADIATLISGEPCMCVGIDKLGVLHHV